MFLRDFRNDKLRNYWLCPSNYFSAADLCWNAMITVIKVELELISETDMYLFFEKDMRWGVSYNSNI